jgi:hypothetical protein
VQPIVEYLQRHWHGSARGYTRMAGNSHA